MNAFISRLIREATAPIAESSTRLVQKAVLFLLALICLFISSIFLIIALFLFLQPLAGNAGAALSVGGLYLFASLLCIFLVTPQRSSRPRGTPSAESAKLAKSAKLMEDIAASDQGKADFVNNIDKTVAPFLDILQEAGMERERLALEAGAEIARQLTPFSLVTFAMVAGFIIGRILGQGNSVRP